MSLFSPGRHPAPFRGPRPSVTAVTPSPLAVRSMQGGGNVIVIGAATMVAREVALGGGSVHLGGGGTAASREVMTGGGLLRIVGGGAGVALEKVLQAGGIVLLAGGGALERGPGLGQTVRVGSLHYSTISIADALRIIRRREKRRVRGGGVLQLHAGADVHVPERRHAEGGTRLHLAAGGDATSLRGDEEVVMAMFFQAAA